MASRTSTVKVTTKRTQKFEHSKPVPLEEDSDSDFNPGSYEYETKKMSRPSRGSVSARGASSKRKRRETLAHMEDYQPSSQYNTKQREAPTPQTDNLLVECFKDIGLDLEPEEETVDADVEEEVEERVSGSEEASDNEAEEHPAVLRTFAVQRPPASNSFTRDKERPDDDSLTESETEPEPEEAEIWSPSSKRKDAPASTLAPPLKKRKIEDDDDSVTESEPEPEPEEPGAKDADSGSETEPDEEGEAEAEKSLQPRPEFVVPPDRKGIRPLVLEPGYVVPWKINTFLRDYQRAGVRFFIERYKEGRGALLGDDMGLGVLQMANMVDFS
ncbi:hypothetical protein FOMPIDRAFT_1054943 [Fomitopsis schrenkii]|uniref:Uncharacterized protein n=1 Tax=Fomitopsis schrenkii TaxID=2126942 RepID=S8DM91_FOMSC|nr:hypothetical protein FOMPIDRAFT_1054943 [Fomitopsis schrenkii]